MRFFIVVALLFGGVTRAYGDTVVEQLQQFTGSKDIRILDEAVNRAVAVIAEAHTEEFNRIYDLEYGKLRISNMYSGSPSTANSTAAKVRVNLAFTDVLIHGMEDLVRHIEKEHLFLYWDLAQQAIVRHAFDLKFSNNVHPSILQNHISRKIYFKKVIG
ncbi:MAG: hypothetical protein ACKVOH_03535 [Chlamydiales bacterium]